MAGLVDDPAATGGEAAPAAVDDSAAIAHLITEARTEDQAGAAPGQGGAPGSAAAPAMDADEIAGTLDFVIGLADMKYSGIDAALTREDRSKLAGAVAAVCAKYGVTLPGFLDKWMPEIMLAYVLGQLVRKVGPIIKRHQEAGADAGADVAVAVGAGG